MNEDALVTKRSQRKYRNERVVTKLIVRIGQYEGYKADLRDFKCPRSGKYVGIEISNLARLICYVAAFYLNTTVNQRLDVIKIVTGNCDVELPGS